MPKINLKNSLFSLLFACALSGLWIATASAATSPGQCPAGNGGAIQCNTGSHFVNGACQLDTPTITNGITTCTGSGKNEEFSCSSGSCVCPSGARDCRNAAPGRCLNTMDASSVDDAGRDVCDPLNRTFDSCTTVTQASECGACINGTQEVDGECLSLAQLDTRVRGLEGLNVCRLVGASYEDANGASCTPTFDDSSLSGQLSVAQTQLQALFNVVMNLFSTGDLRDLLAQIIYGDLTQLGDFVTALNDYIDLNSPLAVALANALGSGGGGGGGTSSVFVGLSSVVADTARVSAGYLTANGYCSGGAGLLAGSHICTSREIIDSYLSADSAVTSRVTTGTAGVAWINNGPPSHLDTLVNDCGGWQENGASQYGAVWNFDNDRGLIQLCNADLRFACCR